MSDLGKNSLNDCGCDNADGEKPVRRHRPGLLPKIIIAIALGIGAGYVCPLWCARLMATFNAVFSQFLGFCIPLIILGFVAPAIAGLCVHIVCRIPVVCHRDDVLPFDDFG